MTTAKPCPECGQNDLYLTTTNSGGGYGPTLLPKLHGFFGFAKFDVVACADCGLTRFFAAPEARARLATTANWRKL